MVRKERHTAGSVLSPRVNKYVAKPTAYPRETWNLQADRLTAAERRRDHQHCKEIRCNPGSHLDLLPGQPRLHCAA